MRHWELGTPLGSARNDECQIDSIAQSWAVTSGSGDKHRARQAMESVEERLVRRNDRLMLLFNLLSPIHHASRRANLHRYNVELYAVAGDVYSQPLRAGRGGWTWYSGAAGWFYRAGLEWILAGQPRRSPAPGRSARTLVRRRFGALGRGAARLDARRFQTTSGCEEGCADPGRV
jgi:cyclic beta-1,2-glucan synthetase